MIGASVDIRGEDGLTNAVDVGGYFRRLDGEVEEWIFSATPPETRTGLRPFRVPRFTRTLSEWLNLLLDSGFVLDRFGEPRPSDEAVRDQPGLQSARVSHMSRAEEAGGTWRAPRSPRQRSA
jgi:hypothetical protein